MIAWSVRAATECLQVTHTFAISDGSEILAIAQRYGARTIQEPDELGGDSVANHQVIQYALNHIQSQGIEPDILVYLQPTSPQRTTDDITRSLKLFADIKTQAVISVYETDNKFLKSFLIEDGELQLLSKEPWPMMPRSLLPKTYMANGAIMAIRTEAFRKSNNLFTSHTVPYVMLAERSIDIDFHDQALQAETQMKKEGRKLDA